MPTFDELRDDYAAQWKRMEILSSKKDIVQSIAKKLYANKASYLAVENKTGVPWVLVAAIHNRESDADFSTYLGNGERLDRITRLVPKGRGPFSSWEAGAIDAIKYDGLDKVKEWPIERICYESEKYNGWGYHNHGVPSAYAWSFSNIYEGGKYISDGEWSSSTWDKQCGTMPIVKALLEMDHSKTEDPPKIHLVKSSDFGKTLVSLALAHGAPPDEPFHIIYAEGTDVGGARNKNRVNAFDDLRSVVDRDGKILGQWRATIETGRRYTEDPINDDGAARIAWGYQKAWQVGLHRGQYEALVQTGGPVKVYRDANKDYQRDGDLLQSGFFGINQHHAFDADPNDIGAHSAGCLVTPRVSDHRTFMQLVKGHPGYQRDHEYVFGTTVLQRSWIDEAMAPKGPIETPAVNQVAAASQSPGALSLLISAVANFFRKK